MSLFTIAVHGGAGTIRREEMSPEMESAYKKGLQDALDAGYAVLSAKGSAVDAVLAAVVSMEDNILFNAGRGSVFGKDGKHEMDAAIMDGSNRAAGAVAAVTSVRNPVKLAMAIMTGSPHVMLSGTGAHEFAKLKGLIIEEESYFYSPFRFQQWQQIKGTDETALDHDVKLKDHTAASTAAEKKFGTVGAVATDINGNIAAATSTGGMTNKQWGRIGDSPIIGAGTYANNQTCAISCTGHGEPFIRAVTAYDVSCLMEYKGLTLEQAMQLVVHDKLLKIDGEGGIIGVDALGHAAMVFNSDGMYRGVKSSNGLNNVLIYREA
ncbi:MAG TPA: isoaspartyl peptidase/L-asparaginase [Chitinophagaceae bacterium]|nr:isoaspartyl peptidase/L-asparaginase [Chitinophagaceae bacterium]